MGTLRTIFALAVAISHAGGITGYVPMNGDAAVQAFYVISGFYMAMVFAEKYSAVEAPARTFWTSRYLRLAPAYLIVSALALWLVEPSPLDGLPLHLRALVLISQLSILGQDVFAFVGVDVSGHLFFVKNFHALVGTTATPMLNYLPVPQGWTLGVEAAFYCTVPWLVRCRTATLASAAGTILMLHALGMHVLGLRGDPWTYRFFPFELAVFLFGMLAYRAMAAGWVSQYQGATFCALTALALAYHYIPGGGAEKRWAFIVALAVALPTIFAFTNSSMLDRWIGDLSYPLYIVHLLAFKVVQQTIGGRWLVSIELAAAIVGAGLIAILVDRPVDALRGRLVSARLKEAPTRAESTIVTR
jgi:peptidoglycan/LPS O-acetylase OafA/YrhL